MWIFVAYKYGIHDDKPRKLFYLGIFFDHGNMKVFSAHHSAKYKKKYPDYCSTYWKVF